MFVLSELVILFYFEYVWFCDRVCKDFSKWFCLLCGNVMFFCIFVLIFVKIGE